MQGGKPGGKFLGQKNAFERSEIASECHFARGGRGFVLPDPQKSGVRRCPSEVAGKKTKKPAQAFGIASNAVEEEKIRPDRLFQVLAGIFQGLVVLSLDDLGPPAAAKRKRQVFRRQVGYGRHLPLSLEKCAKADGAVRFARFPERHRAHAKPRDSSCARMKDLFRIGERRGGGEKKLSRFASSVDFAAGGVPDRGKALPLVQKHRRLSLSVGEH